MPKHSHWSRGLLVVVLLLAGVSAAKHRTCDEKAARAQRGCTKACAQTKDRPEIKEKMKAAQVKDCDALCSALEKETREKCKGGK